MISKRPDLIVVDNWHPDPERIRSEALGQEFIPRGSYGKRTKNRFLNDWMREQFELLTHTKISNWDDGVNGCYQYCHKDTPIIFHCDNYEFGGALYLSPDAPLNSGTSFWRSKHSGLYGPEINSEFTIFNSHKPGKEFFHDQSKFELVDKIGNRFNRLVIWNSKRIHSASAYFGDELNSARLFQVFFFNSRQNTFLDSSSMFY